MAHRLAQTLARTLSAAKYSAPAFVSVASSSRAGSVRGRSTLPAPPPASPDSAGEVAEVELCVNDIVRYAIHAAIVRRGAPDWLPFVPGASYWLPPVRVPDDMVDLIGRIAGAVRPVGMPAEELDIKIGSSQGWPSASYFIEGRSSHTGNIRKSRTVAAQSDDEDDWYLYFLKAL